MPLGGIALHALLQCRLDRVAIVVHPQDPLYWISPEVKARLAHPESAVRIVRSERAEDGMAYSLRSGLEYLLSFRPGEPDAVAVVLADQPFVDEEHLNRLLGCYRSQPGLDFAASAKEAGDGTSVLMPPVVLSRAMFEAVRELEGDAGARKLLALPRFKGSSLAPGANDILFDVDDPADLERAVERFASFAG